MDVWLLLLIDILSWAFMGAGGIFLIIGALGLLRLPDFWARLHGAGIVDTLGAELVLVGMMFQAGLTQTTIKLALIGIFVFFTSPTATHALANAAFVAGLRPLGMSKDESKKGATSE